MSALSFPYCVGTPRAFINMASLYIYLCGDDTTRVFYIYGVVCVKFVNRQTRHVNSIFVYFCVFDFYTAVSVFAEWFYCPLFVPWRPTSQKVVR